MQTNEDRAEQVAGALGAFAAESGLGIGLDSDGPITVAGDMIASILHWVESQHPDGRKAALDAVKSGIGHYVSESNIDYGAQEVDELGPDAWVTIDVQCNGQTWAAATAQESEIIKP